MKEIDDYFDFQCEDETMHKYLVDRVLSLNKNQHVKKPSRTEPTLQISEFNLVNSVTGENGSVQLTNLTSVLNNHKNHLKNKESIKNVTKNTQTLPKPLEKPEAERVRRTVAYEKTRLELDQWEPIVTSNRVSTNLSFPLPDMTKLEWKTSNDITKMWRVKSKLQKALEEIQPKVEKYEIIDDKKAKFPLTMKEMLTKRQETAKLRAFQTYKEAKARRQNKIKSKKYHRIQRREKIKEKLKEFEELQKTNPEEALKKLDEIEKARIEERFSLRHRSTGKWAKSKQIRAKYDRESRQVLAQQLSISRELTQKMKATNSDSENERDDEEEVIDLVNNSKLNRNNPWVSNDGIKANEEITEFVSNYKKYWNEKSHSNCNENGIVKAIEDQLLNDNQTSNNKENRKGKGNGKQKTCSIKNKQEKKRVRCNEKQTKIIGNQNIIESLSTTPWEVTVLPTSNTENIECIFNKLEHKLQKKVKKELKQMKKKLKSSTEVSNKSPPIKKQTKYKVDLTLPSQSKKQIIDKELLEAPERIIIDNSTNSANDNDLRTLLESDTNKETTIASSAIDIDPNKFLNVKVTKLKTAIPDLMTTEDEVETDQKNLISEAFEDDDIVQDFNEEKTNEIEKSKPKDINLNLPGWGEWGGSGILPNKRKNRRFIIKVPEKMPRRDDNKGSLIINEKAQQKIKEHLVTEVPFPFKTVKDYEASIRAPIGNTFVPELAFRKYIKPTVNTKMGTIIAPMSDRVLLNIKD